MKDTRTERTVGTGRSIAAGARSRVDPRAIQTSSYASEPAAGTAGSQSPGDVSGPPGGRCGVSRQRTGRRPGNPDTRSVVLAAAEQVFAEKGYTAATIRSIATRAGVDAALVHHYFGTKQELFLATVRVPIDPSAMVAHLAVGDPADLGRRLVRTLVGVWDSGAGTGLVALLRSALTEPDGARLVQEFVTTAIVAKLLRALHLPRTEAQVRGALVATTVVGLVTGRYVLRLPELVAMSPDELAVVVGPTIDRYLSVPLTQMGRSA